jgi:hypothetical protein
VIGPDELAIYVALALIAAGCWVEWPLWRRAALLVPGSVMVWMYLPQRTAFLDRPMPKTGKRPKD